jgi:hypothetical protein
MSGFTPPNGTPKDINNRLGGVKCLDPDDPNSLSIHYPAPHRSRPPLYVVVVYQVPVIEAIRVTGATCKTAGYDATTWGSRGRC